MQNPPSKPTYLDEVLYASQVMHEAATNPEAEVQYRLRDLSPAKWMDCFNAELAPSWDWSTYDYRIKPTDESHKAPDSPNAGSNPHSSDEVLTEAEAILITEERVDGQWVEKKRQKLFLNPSKD